MAKIALSTLRRRDRLASNVKYLMGRLARAQPSGPLGITDTTSPPPGFPFLKASRPDKEESNPKLQFQENNFSFRVFANEMNCTYFVRMDRNQLFGNEISLLCSVRRLKDFGRISSPQQKRKLHPMDLSGTFEVLGS